MVLTQIWVYPVKSLAGFTPHTWALTPRGLQYDRRWMLVDANGKFLSQRMLPRMASFDAIVADGRLLIKERNNPDNPLLLTLEEATTGDACSVTVWDDTVQALAIAEPRASEWLSSRLGQEAHLVYMPDESKRPVDPKYAHNGEQVSFADGFPYLIAQESSLNELSSRMGWSVEMRRFRPNLVISGGMPWEEDTWKEVDIGSERFLTPKPCARCVMVNVHPETAEKGQEPLRTLSQFRNVGNKVIFGMNACLQSTVSGFVSMGDKVQVRL